IEPASLVERIEAGVNPVSLERRSNRQRLPDPVWELALRVYLIEWHWRAGGGRWRRGGALRGRTLPTGGKHGDCGNDDLDLDGAYLRIEPQWRAPNGVRLSCGAKFEHTQTYDSLKKRRRQLQALVRQQAT